MRIFLHGRPSWREIKDIVRHSKIIRVSAGTDAGDFMDIIKMDIGAEDIPDVMIQHGGGMDGVSDRDCILTQERHRLFNIFPGNGENRVCDILKDVTCLMGKNFLVYGIVPNGILGTSYIILEDRWKSSMENSSGKGITLIILCRQSDSGVRSYGRLWQRWRMDIVDLASPFLRLVMRFGTLAVRWR